MRTVLVILFLLVSRPGYAASGWFTPFDTTDTVLYGLALTANTADMLTTLDIKNHPPDTTSTVGRFGLHETNPVMGPHPSDAQVIGYFVAVDALEGAIGYMLPPAYRKTFYVLDFGVESYYTVHNYSMGLHFAF